MPCSQLEGGGCKLTDTGTRVAEGAAVVHFHVPDHGGSHHQHRGGALLPSARLRLPGGTVMMGRSLRFVAPGRGFS